MFLHAVDKDRVYGPYSLKFQIIVKVRHQQCTALVLVSYEQCLSLKVKTCADWHRHMLLLQWTEVLDMIR